MNVLNKLKANNEFIINNSDDGYNLNYYKAIPINTIEVVAATFNAATGDQLAAHESASLFVSTFATLSYPKSKDIIVTEVDRRLISAGTKDVYSIICKLKIYQGFTTESRPVKEVEGGRE